MAEKEEKFVVVKKENFQSFSGGCSFRSVGKAHVISTFEGIDVFICVNIESASITCTFQGCGRVER